MSTFAEVCKASWDTETTGPDPLNDRIVSAAFIVRTPGADDLISTWLINPGIPIPAEATEVHKITDAMVQADGQDPKVALEEIATYVAYAVRQSMPVIAFNQAFDWSILNYDLARNGLPTLSERVGPGPLSLIDPHIIDKEFFKYVRGQGNRKLAPTAERYNVALNDWHTADADALAALMVAEEQFERFGHHIGHLTPERLFAAQQRWRAAQQAGLQAHLRKEKPEAYCAPEWPLIPAQRGGESA